MRRLASLLLLGVALAAGAATEVWRWKDANGVVHYSDSPVPGAEKVQLDTPPASAVPRASPATGTAAPEPQPEPPRTVRYTRCEMTEPSKDQNYRLGETVSAVLTVEPDLQPGHRVLVNLNNSAYADWPPEATTFLMNGLFRGSYTLSARVVDANDRVQCTAPAVSFHVRQASILSPVRQPPKK